MESRYSKLAEDDAHAAETRGAPDTGLKSWFFRSTLLRIISEVIVIGLLYFLSSRLILHNTRAPEPTGYTELPEVIRQPPQIIKSFSPASRFYGYTNGSSEAWAALMPRGRGFIAVEEPRRLGLEPGIPVTKTADRFALSAFHQLHCLANLREAYYQLKLQKDPMTPAEHHHEPKHEHQHSDHIDHCWDYLRQVISCFADPTLEAAKVEEDGSRQNVDGWYTQHQCRDWEALWEFAYTNRADDSEGLIAD